MRKIKTYSKLYSIIMGALDQFFKKKESPNLWKISILEEIIEHYKKEGKDNG